MQREVPEKRGLKIAFKSPVMQLPSGVSPLICANMSNVVTLVNSFCLGRVPGSSNFNKNSDIKPSWICWIKYKWLVEKKFLTAKIFIKRWFQIANVMFITTVR